MPVIGLQALSPETSAFRRARHVQKIRMLVNYGDCYSLKGSWGSHPDDAQAREGTSLRKSSATAES